MSDKGTNITCQATDDRGKVSTMSSTVTLDPYYGPDDVKLEPPNTVINVTEGSTLGPIRCNANCNPKCKYQWKQNVTGSFKNVETKFVSNVNQNLNVSNIKRGQAATFFCRVDHQYSNHKERTEISVNVQYIRRCGMSSSVKSFRRENQRFNLFKKRERRNTYEPRQQTTTTEHQIPGQVQTHAAGLNVLIDFPAVVAIWLSDKDGIAGHGNPTTYYFNEDVNIMTTQRINSNPESKLFLRSYLKIYQLNHTKVATDYKSKLISLKCEDSGNFEIQARNGIPYGDYKTVNFIISCKPRNVTTRSRRIGTNVNTRENIELQVVSFPKPTVEWLRSTGFDWTVKQDIYNYKYKINSTIHIGSENDFGEYGIRICNNLGCDDVKTIFTAEVKPTLSPCAPSNSASVSHLTVGLVCGIPPLLVVCVLLVYISRRNKYSKRTRKRRK